MHRRTLLLVFLAVVVVTTAANAQSLQTLVAYKGANPQYCSDSPQVANSFTAADTNVNIFFVLTGMKAAGGDTVEIHWINPSNAWTLTTGWGSSPNNGYSTRCYYANLPIAMYISPNWGAWHAQIVVNNNNIGSPLTFQVSATAQSGPSYTGSFDNVDCSHIFGWAKDNNNPNGTVNVEIDIDGNFWEVVPAGDYRSDVGNHAFNEYSLPTNFKNGQPHTIRVRYAGTTTELPGSTKTFQNSCGTAPVAIRPGAVVTLPNNGTVYYVHSTGLYGFPSADAFYSWGYQFSSVVPANSAEAALPIQPTVIPVKQAGCSDPISQIKGLCGNSLTATWVSGGQPPATMTSGQTFSVSYQVNGPSSINSRVCYGTSADPNTLCQQNTTSWQYSGPSSLTAPIAAPAVTSNQTYYFVVQAQWNGQTAYSLTATSTISPKFGGRNLWVFTSDNRALRTPIDPKLSDFIIVVEKISVTAGVPMYQYKISVLGDNFHEISASVLTMIVEKNVNIDINSPTVFRLPNIAGGGIFDSILDNTDSGWEDLSVQQPIIDFGSSAAVLMKDAIGFIPYVGTGSAIVDGIGDIAALFKDSPSVLPSSDFTNKVRDLNQYHRLELAATRLRPPFLVSGTLVYAVRFTVIVDETNGKPSFFLRSKNSQNKIVGVEFGNLQ